MNTKKFKLALVSHLFLLGLSAFVVTPLLPLFREAFFSGNNFSLFTNFQELFRRTDFLRWLLNSFLLTSLTVGIGLLTSMTTAYQLAFVQTKRHETFLKIIFFTQIAPNVLLMLPMFLIASALNLVDTYSILIVLYIASSIPVSIWLLTHAFRTVDAHLVQSAKLDGASDFKILFRIVLPICLPSLATVLGLNFANGWNEYILASALILSKKLTTWPIGMNELLKEPQSFPIFSVGALLLTFPMLFLFYFFSQSSPRRQ
jgi:ABC-type glycerol-3-phosphate transport system permease component